MPRVGRDVLTPDGAGQVIDLNILKETVCVRIPKGDSSDVKDYPLEEVKRIFKGPQNAAEQSSPSTEPDEADDDPDTVDTVPDQDIVPELEDLEKGE